MKKILLAGGAAALIIGLAVSGKKAQPQAAADFNKDARQYLLNWADKNLAGEEKGNFKTAVNKMSDSEIQTASAFIVNVSNGSGSWDSWETVNKIQALRKKYNLLPKYDMPVMPNGDNPKVQEIIDWMDGREGFDDKKAVLNALVRMSPSEIDALHTFIFKMYDGADKARTEKDAAILRTLGKKYGIKSMLDPQYYAVPNSPNQNSGKTIQKPASGKSTNATDAKRLKQIRELKDLFSKSTKDSQQSKNHFYAALDKMNASEVDDVHNFVFNYMLKKKKPTDKSYVLRMALISQKYKIFG